MLQVNKTDISSVALVLRSQSLGSAPTPVIHAAHGTAHGSVRLVFR